MTPGAAIALARTFLAEVQASRPRAARVVARGKRAPTVRELHR